MFHFLQSELLSRRLAHFCCKRIAIMFNDFTQSSHFDKAIKQLPQPPQIISSSSAPIQHQYVVKNQVTASAVRGLFARMVKCPQHHDMLRSMLSVVYSVQLGCMQALVWNRVGEMGGVSGGPYNGSALDFLPCAPSQLLPIVMRDAVYRDGNASENLMAIAAIANNNTDETQIGGGNHLDNVDQENIVANHSGFHLNNLIDDDGWCEFARRELERAELCVRRRSLAVETRWASDKLRPAAIAIVQAKVSAFD